MNSRKYQRSKSVVTSFVHRPDDEATTETTNSFFSSDRGSSRPMLQKSQSEVSSRIRNILTQEIGLDSNQERSLDSNPSLSNSSSSKKDGSDKSLDKSFGRKLSSSLLSVPSLLTNMISSPITGRKRSKSKTVQIDNKVEREENVQSKRKYSVDLLNFKIYARRELVKIYKQFKIPFPIRWLVKGVDKIYIEEIFVEPDLTFNRNLVPLKDLFIVEPNRVQETPIIMIKGEAGTGKTALCHYLTYNWCNKLNEIHLLDSFDFVFMMELHFMQNDDVLTQLRAHYLTDTCNELSCLQDDKQLLSMINDSHTLFLLDGFDEANDKCMAKLAMIKRDFYNAKIVITTRHCAMRDLLTVLDLNINYDIVELLLNKFNDTRKVNLILKLSETFGKSDEEQVKLLDDIEDKFVNFDEVLNTPLCIILYVIIWIHDDSKLIKICNVNDLYCQTVELMKDQLYRQLGMDKFIDNIHAKEKISNVILAYGKMSLKCIHGKQFFFAPLEYNIIKKAMSDMKLNGYIVFPTIMQQVDHLSAKNLRIFFHTSVMEYLAAVYVDYVISTTDHTIYDIISQKKSDDTSESCTSCIEFSKDRIYSTNIEENNHQLDSVVLFLFSISIENDHSSECTGNHASKYFPMMYNRNLQTLANIVRVAQDDDLFMRGIRKGLSKQKLPELVNHWSIKHILTLLSTKAIKPSMHIKFSVENKREWGETVNELVRYGCKPYVKVVIEQPEQMQSLLNALQVIENPKIPKLILHFGYIEIGFKELVDRWPHPKPMHILSCQDKYSIEAYFVCVALVNILGHGRMKHISFFGDESSYIFGMLKTSLPNIKVHLIPSEKTEEYVIIYTKNNQCVKERNVASINDIELDIL